jgi:hypothetical protein
MRLIRQIFSVFRRRHPAPAGGYGAEVLFAGWVDLPASFRELAKRRGASANPNRSLSA